MAVLSGRRLTDEFTMELKNMVMTVDIEKNAFLREIRDTALAGGRAEGEAKGRSILLARMLEERFGPLPGWARLRLEHARLAQIERWAKKALVAPTLEDVVGKRTVR
jgi:predicted transposase YdaD